jgi:hypothetical protein
MNRACLFSGYLAVFMVGVGGSLAMTDLAAAKDKARMTAKFPPEFTRGQVRTGGSIKSQSSQKRLSGSIQTADCRPIEGQER